MVFIERASVAVELGERAFRPADPLPAGTGAAVACDLYRQAIHWALLAHRASVTEIVAPYPALPELWDETEPALLARAAGRSEDALRLRVELVGKSFVELAELQEGRCGELVERARTLVKGLLEALEPERKKVERRWLRRAWLVAGGVVTLVALVLVARTVSGWIDGRRDLAVGAPWTTSSIYAVGGCVSPKQDCVESPNYFFHTSQENDPWLLLDLRKVKTTSSVVVTNRLDCCPERAVPLVVELSRDKKNWVVVGQRDKPFDTWRASYPKTEARWVKVHVPQPNGILHLKSVRVLP